MFGYLKNENGLVAVANRIFETRLYNRYLSEDITGSAISDAADLGRDQFVSNGFLNMESLKTVRRHGDFTVVEELNDK